MGKGKKEKKDKRTKDQLRAELAAAEVALANAKRETAAAALALEQAKEERDEREKDLLPWLNFAARVKAEWCKTECPGRRVTTFFIGDSKQQVAMLTTEEQWLALL